MNRRLFLTTSCAAAVSPFLPKPAMSMEAANAPVAAGILARLGEPGLGDNRATYLPDGRTLLFASTRSGQSQIWAMNQDGSHLRQVHKSSGNDYGRVAPNADGARLCFSSDRSGQNAVYVLDRRDGRIDLISDPNFWSFGPTWSSSDRIAFFSKRVATRSTFGPCALTDPSCDKSPTSLAKVVSRGGLRMAACSRSPLTMQAAHFRSGY